MLSNTGGKDGGGGGGEITISFKAIEDKVTLSHTSATGHNKSDYDTLLVCMKGNVEVN